MASNFPPALVEYVKNARASGLRDATISENLVKTGWKPEQVTDLLATVPRDAAANSASSPSSAAVQSKDAAGKKGSKKDSKKSKMSTGMKILIVAIILFLIVAGIGAYFYFFIVAPLSGKVLDLDVQKVESEIDALRAGTLLPADFIIRPEHFTYLLWKIDGHKIHPDPFSEELAEVEIVVSDQDVIYTAENRGDGLRTVDGASGDPDVRFTLTKSSLITMLMAEDRRSSVRDQTNSGGVQIEVLKGEEVLALKGYKGIYDSIAG